MKDDDEDDNDNDGGIDNDDDNDDQNSMKTKGLRGIKEWQCLSCRCVRSKSLNFSPGTSPTEALKESFQRCLGSGLKSHIWEQTESWKAEPEENTH